MNGTDVEKKQHRLLYTQYVPGLNCETKTKARDRRGYMNVSEELL